MFKYNIRVIKYLLFQEKSLIIIIKKTKQFIFFSYAKHYIHLSNQLYYKSRVNCEKLLTKTKNGFHFHLLINNKLSTLNYVFLLLLYFP